MQFVPLAGFVPDAPETTPGIVTACSGWIPSFKGLKAAPTPVDAGYGALSGPCLGMFVARKVDDSTRVFAGTATKLYESVSGSWVDQSRVSGGAYSASTDHWRFAQWGNITFAVNRYDTPQTTSSGAFADHANGMPPARLIATGGPQGQFIMLGATNEGTYGDQPNRWWCSAIGNPTGSSSWVPAIATQSATGQLQEVSGPLTGMVLLDQSYVAYKKRGMWLGTYQGPPIVWGWRLVSRDIGCPINEAVVVVEHQHYFIGPDDIYVFAGDVPQPIGGGIKEFFFADMDETHAEKITGMHDWLNGLVWWFYPSTSGGGTIDHWIAFNLRTQKWGAGALTVEMAGATVTAGPTYDTVMGSQTYDQFLATTTYDAAFGPASSQFPAVFLPDHKLYGLSGAAGDSILTFATVGDEERFAVLRRAQPRWVTRPSAATLVHAHTDIIGQGFTEKTAVNMSRGRFDLWQNARWHRTRLTTTGDAEIDGVNYDIIPSGRE